jgi:hypothetical protein
MVCLVAAVMLVGCAAPSRRSTGPDPNQLAARFTALDPSVDPAEARQIATVSVHYCLELAKDYRVITPPILHNFYVNLGLRKRGLCYQWADDLAAKIQTLPLHTLEMHRGVARMNTSREHSSVVITAVGQPFDQGVVLDAWRHSGYLYWGDVKTDKYPWIHIYVDEPDTSHRKPAANTAKAPEPKAQPN